MAPPASEIVSVPLKPGSNIHDPSTPEGQLILDAMKTIVAQPGCQRAFWGTRVEDPGILVMFIQWETINSHYDFMKSDIYEPFLKYVGAIMGGELTMFHVPLDPHPGLEALSDTIAPVTEVLMSYSPADGPETERDSLSKAIQTLVDSVREVDGFKGFTGGWSFEELDNEKIGGKAKVHLGCVGWESIDAHMKARETEGFKRTIEDVRGHSARKAATVFHVKLTEVQHGGE